MAYRTLIERTLIEQGAYLVYSTQNGNLLDTDEEELQTLYDPRAR
jgi:hypothetical protein